MDLREARARTEIVRHPWELARFEVVNDILLQHFEALDELQVLDLGCGDTFFVENLAQRFLKSTFYGVDIEFKADDLAYYAEAFEDKPIAVFDSLEQMEQQRSIQQIDAVLLLDVVEHIEYDVEFLKMLYSKNYITENTKIFITVPAFQSLYTTHDDFLGHYRRYTNATLVNTIQQAGFQKIKVGYFFASLLPVRLLKVFKERLIGKDQESTGLVEWSGSAATTTLMKQILVADYKISRFFRKIGIKILGLSNYIVTKKGDFEN
ncbi:MAG: methyltransferase domain-containing protein [Bacteroidota bacterium]